ncbi:MAG: hypothetical protein N2Z68_02150 [Patescibacteria group bacterium]|nr:hypothetical protein [Patescibacteria group bacterium]
MNFLRDSHKHNTRKFFNSYFLKRSLKATILISFVFYLISGFNQRVNSQGLFSTFLGDIAIATVVNAVSFVLGIIQWIVGAVLIKGAALLVTFALNINMTLVSDLNENHFVVYGWTVFRDLTNLGFVLGIIVIAVATILRLREYTYQKLLPKLIAAALLVNFSLVIATSIISLSDVFSKFFINYISGQGSDPAAISTAGKQLADAFQFTSLIMGGNIGSKPECLEYKAGTSKNSIENSCSVIGGVAEAIVTIPGIGSIVGAKTYQQCVDLATARACLKWRGSELFEDIPPDNTFLQKIKEDNALANSLYQLGGVFISIIVGFFIFLTLLALVGYLILRYFNLAFLLMLSPIVWILWVFPNTQNSWKKWWDSFIKWTFFAPITLFFLYLTLYFLSVSGGYGPQARIVGITSQASVAGIGLSNIIMPLMAGALLLGGLKIAMTLGFAGASFTLKAANSLGGWAKKKVQRGGARVGRRMLGEPTRKVLNKIGSSKVANILTLGGARRLAQGATAARVALEKKSQEYVEQRIGQYNSIDSKKLAALIPTMNNQERLAALEILSRRGDLNEAQKYIKDIDEIRRSLEVAQTLGRGKAVSDIQKSMGMTIEMMKAIKAGAPIEVERDGKKVTMSYEELAKEYYEKFSPSDWAKTASALGNSIFDPSGRNLPGMTDEQSKLFRKSFVDNIIKGVGEGISATLPKLSRKSAREMMKKVFQSLSDSLPDLEEKEIIEKIPIDEAIEKAEKEKNISEITRLNSLKWKGETHVEVSRKVVAGVDKNSILQAIQDDDLDRAVDLMKNSGDPRLINIANKFSKSIGSALLLTKEEEKKESSSPTPPPAKPSGGGGGKSGGTP